MEDFGAQNTAHANIESRSPPARSFRCPGSVKNDRAVIKLLYPHFFLLRRPLFLACPDDICRDLMFDILSHRCC